MNETQNIYDNDDFFDGYAKLRENPFSANIIEEKPALFKLSPDLANKSILDLGCGMGENCKKFIRLGAKKVLGVDISQKMLAIAKKEVSQVEFLQIDMNDLSDIKSKFDVIFSSLAVHYIKNFNKFCNQVANLLNDNGYFVFSQEHPLTTAPKNGASWTKDENGERLHYNLFNYSQEGERKINWIVDGVIKYHRTFSNLINTLVNNDFIIEECTEPVPDKAVIEKLPNFKNSLHKPNFLLFKCRKKCK